MWRQKHEGFYGAAAAVTRRSLCGLFFFFFFCSFKSLLVFCGMKLQGEEAGNRVAGSEQIQNRFTEKQKNLSWKQNDSGRIFPWKIMKMMFRDLRRNEVLPSAVTGIRYRNSPGFSRFLQVPPGRGLSWLRRGSVVLLVLVGFGLFGSEAETYLVLNSERKMYLSKNIYYFISFAWLVNRFINLRKIFKFDFWP